MGRLVTYFLLFSLTVVALAVYITGRQARIALEESAVRQLGAMVSVKQNQVANWMEEKTRDVALWSRTEELRGPVQVLVKTRPGEPAHALSHSRLEAFLESVDQTGPDIREVMLLHPETGAVLVSSDADGRNTSHSGKPYLLSGMKGACVTGMGVDESGEDPGLVVSSPIRNLFGDCLAILAVVLNLAHLEESMLAHPGSERGQSLYIVNRRGRLMAGNLQSTVRRGQQLRSFGIDQTMRGEQGRGLYADHDGVPVIGAYRWLEKYGLGLIAEISQQEAFQPARELARTVLFMGLPLAALLIVGIVFLARRVSAPIEQITESAQAVAGGDLSRKVDITSRDQIGNLARTFNWMTDQLEAMYSGMREKMGQIQAERARAAENERRFRALIENASDMISVMDADAVITYQSPAVERILGYTPGEVEGTDMFRWFHPDDAKLMRERLPRMLRHRGMLPAAEYRLLHKDGTYRLLELFGNNLLDDPVVNGFVVNLRDVTKRRLAEHALWEEKERLNVTLRSIADGVIVCDRARRVVLMNPAAEALTGMVLSSCLGESCGRLLNLVDPQTGEPAPDVMQQALETGQPARLDDEAEIISRKGERRLVSNSAAPVRDRRGQVVAAVLTIHDVTEHHKYEQELQKIQKLESVGVLAGGIAHDFNNILTGIVGNLALAKMYAKGNDKAAAKIVEAENAALNARELTQQLLTFAKGGAPVRRSTDMERLVRETAGFVLSGSSVGMDLDTDPELYPAHVDAGLIRQAVQNLVLNASQARPEDGMVHISVKNEEVPQGAETSLRPGGYVRISITDRGEGIAQEHLERIFDPYFSTKKEGSGLGLATTYSIVKRHGGTIEVDSEPGRGSTFTMFLRASSEQPAPQNENGAGQKVARRRNRGRILLMDDENVVLNVTAEMLSALGYRVDTARDGARAVRMYKKALKKKKPYDAVIMDLTVPGGMGGREAMEYILEVDPDVIAIVASGYSSDPVMSEPTAYGFSGVIAKPFTVQNLGETLRDVLEGNRPGGAGGQKQGA